MIDFNTATANDLKGFLFWIEGDIACSGCDFAAECTQEQNGTSCIEFLYKKYKEYEVVINDIWDDLYDEDGADWDDIDDFVDFVDPFWDDLDDDDDELLQYQNDYFDTVEGKEE